MSDLPPLFKKQVDRWYPLKAHPEQVRFDSAIDNGVRFCVVPAGRRSGKTERAKRIVAKQALINPNEKYFCCAPTNTQSVKIFWDDMLKFTFSYVHKQKPNKSLRIIYLPNGTEIHIFGLDAPSRFEGINWTGGTIDEIADVRGEAIDAHIMPALNTVTPDRPDYRPWCLFTGVPDGLNHYYDMAEYARTSGDPDWAYFHWKSAEILPPDIIASAKRSMSLKQYKQEYEASFETAGGKIYEDYSDENYTGSGILPHESLHWSHDQNYTPLSSCVAVIRGNDVYFLDEIVLESAVSRQSALEFVEKFKRHENKTVYVYGDPAGRAGEKHGHKSDYTEIENVLRENGWKFERRVKPAHPSIKDRQNAVRAKIKNAAGHVSLYINPIKAPWCHKALATCQLKDGSSFQEDEKNKYQHISTAIGYFIDKLYPVGQSAKKSQILSGHY